MDCQLEFSFMTALRLKVMEVNSYNEEDLIAIFEGCDLAWMGLIFIDSWYELPDRKINELTEVMIFKDKETDEYYRAERAEGGLQITNDIDRYDLESDLESFDNIETMVQLPLVKLEDKVWKYL